MFVQVTRGTGGATFYARAGMPRRPLRWLARAAGACALRNPDPSIAVFRAPLPDVRSIHRIPRQTVPKVLCAAAVRARGFDLRSKRQSAARRVAPPLDNRNRKAAE